MAQPGLRNALLLLVLVVLHFSLRPLFLEWPVAPDLLTAAVLLGSLSLRAGNAALLGFTLGLLEEAIALAGGWTLLLYTLVGFGGARFRDVIFADVRFFVPLYLFSATWLIHVAIAVLTASLDATTGLVIAPADALLTAAIGGLAERQLRQLSSTSP